MTNTITRVGAGTPRGGQFATTTHQESHLELSPTVMGNPVITTNVRPVDEDETVEDPGGALTYRRDGTRVQATALDSSGAMTTTDGVCVGVQPSADVLFNTDVEEQVVRHDDGTLGAYHPEDVTRDTVGPLWTTTGNEYAAARSAHRNGHALTVAPDQQGLQAQWSITTAEGHRLGGRADTAGQACAAATKYSDHYAAAQARRQLGADRHHGTGGRPPVYIEEAGDDGLRAMLGGKDPNSFTPPF